MNPREHLQNAMYEILVSIGVRKEKALEVSKSVSSGMTDEECEHDQKHFDNFCRIYKLGLNVSMISKEFMEVGYGQN